MKIVIDEDIPFIRNVFEPYAEVVYLPGGKFTKEIVKDADALVVRTRTFCNETLLGGSSVRFIASATIGYDHIDTAWCAANGVEWSNAAGCNAAAVGQYVVCAILEIAHRKQINLAGKTLGIVGVGHVGGLLQQLAQALQMEVLLNDPPRAAKEGAAAFVDLESLAAQADFVSFHVPLHRSGQFPTFHLASANFFERMKQGAVFINSSRGEVTDEFALRASILNKKIGAAVLDVWEQEPDLDASLLPLVDLVSPHIAGYSAQGKANATSMSVQKVAHVLGLPLTDWQVNLEQPSPSILFVDGTGRTMQEILYAAMAQTYSILNDDRNLRATPTAFEQLRKAYFYRHEPLSYQLDVKNMPEGGSRLLSLLGFTVV